MDLRQDTKVIALSNLSLLDFLTLRLDLRHLLISINDSPPSLSYSEDGITSRLRWLRDFNRFDSSHKGMSSSEGEFSRFRLYLRANWARGILSSSSLLTRLECNLTEPCSESTDTASDSSSGCGWITFSGSTLMSCCSSSLSVSDSDSGAAAYAALRNGLPLSSFGMAHVSIFANLKSSLWA